MTSCLCVPVDIHQDDDRMASETMTQSNEWQLSQLYVYKESSCTLRVNIARLRCYDDDDDDI